MGLVPITRLLILVVAACTPRVAGREPSNVAPVEGIAVAIYASGERGYAVVDDRRWIDVSGDSVLLDRIDPGAALQSLVIEPLGGDAIRVGQCVRERIDDSAAGLASLAEARGERPKRVIVIHGLHDPSPERFHFEDTDVMEPAVQPKPSVLSPVVRCRVTARPGKHLVRVLHVTGSVAYRTRHDLTMTSPDKVSVVTRFAIATPQWKQRAQVSLFEGMPGDTTPPLEVARGPIVLDGSTAILSGEPREIGARIRSVYDGAKPVEADRDVKPSDITWGRESRHQVWVWIEVTDPKLPSGPVRAHVALPGQPVRDVEVASDVVQRTDEVTRWPLWIDDDLLGSRQRTIDRADGVMITDRVQIQVANLGAQPREVWIEERLRPAKRRTVGQVWPTRPTFTKELARMKLVIAPGQTERLGFTIDYEL